MTCEIVDIDISNRKLRVKCDGVEETMDLSEKDCKIIQQGKNPPKTVMVRCNGKG